MSKFTITRSTGMVGVVQNVAVYLNGELVDKLANDESKTLTFEGDSVELQVGQSFMKSHKIHSFWNASYARSYWLDLKLALFTS